MNKIEGVLFAIIAVLFIAGGTWLVHYNHTVVEQEKQLIAEYEAQKPVIKEIKRPDQCDDISARMAWSEIHIGNKQYKNCWWDQFDYRGSVETRTSFMWIVCPNEVDMPDSLKSYKLNRVFKKKDYIYEFECKWIDYSKVTVH
jgi:hypothetical protein